MKQEERIRPSNPPNPQNPRKFEVDDFDEKAIFLCQFCGGTGCDQENYLTNKIQPNAIEGLHSNWITGDILAMQRPSERLIKQFGLYAKFKDNNIRTVLNLQQPGEHPFCGDGIIPNVGFSYIPQNFYSHGIRCFNQSWEDMTATTFEHMMKIMNLFDLTISQGGRISVHCHAGRGRTLLVICSWLIYYDRMPAQATINLAVQKRQGVLTRSSQREFLVYFQQELQARWRSYKINPPQKSFSDFVEWQTGSLLNKQKKNLHKTPVIHYRLLTLLRVFLDKSPTKTIQSLLSPFSAFESKWVQSCEGLLSAHKQQINAIKFSGIQKEQDPRILSQLLFDFYDELPYTLVTSITVQCIQQLLDKKPQSSKLAILLEPAVVHDLGISGLAVVLDICHFLGIISDKLNDNQTQNLTEKEESIKINQSILEALFIKMALVFLSKRKYFPSLYPPTNPRDCRIYRYILKIKKVVNSQILFLAQFLKDLTKELPKDVEDLQRLIFKACKVDSNLYFLTKQSPQLLSEEKKQQIYDNARIHNI